MSPPSGSVHDVAMSFNAFCKNKVLAKGQILQSSLLVDTMYHISRGQTYGPF